MASVTATSSQYTTQSQATASASGSQSSNHSLNLKRKATDSVDQLRNDMREQVASINRINKALTRDIGKLTQGAKLTENRLKELELNVQKPQTKGKKHEKIRQALNSQPQASLNIKTPMGQGNDKLSTLEQRLDANEKEMAEIDGGLKKWTTEFGTNADEIFGILKNDMQKLREEQNGLLTALADREQDKKRIAALESTVEQLKKQVAALIANQVNPAHSAASALGDKAVAAADAALKETASDALFNPAAGENPLIKEG